MGNPYRTSRRGTNPFGENLRRMAFQRGWTQEYIAEQVGVAQSRVSKWFNGTIQTGEHLIAVSKLFGCTAEEMCTVEGPTGQQGPSRQTRRPGHGKLEDPAAELTHFIRALDKAWALRVLREALESRSAGGDPRVWQDRAITAKLKLAIEEAAKLPAAGQDALASRMLIELADEDDFDRAIAGSTDVPTRLTAEAVIEHRAGLTEELDLEGI